MHADGASLPGRALDDWLALKRLPRDHSACIPIDGSVRLVLLASNDFSHHANQLASWRNAAKGCFFTEFHATPAATLHWLHSRYLPSDELLFLLYVNDEPLGHVGLGGFNTAHLSAEIGRVLLAPTALGRGLMQRSLRTIVAFAADVLHIKRLWLEVFADNLRALSCYWRCGFVIGSRRTFACTQSEGCCSWMPIGVGGLAHGRLREVLRLEISPRCHPHPPPSSAIPREPTPQ